MAPPTYIRGEIGYCHFDDCTLVLDIAADRYWRIDAAEGAVLEAIGRGDDIERHAPLAERLASLGFLSTTASRAARPLPAAASGSALEHRAHRRAIGPNGLEVWALTGWAHLMVRTRSLRRNIAGVVRHRHALPPHPSGDIAELARDFCFHRRLVPLKPLCLPDSLACLHFMMRRGHDARLIFGVAAHPFSAHCWVQSGSMVLNDALGNTGVFKPILAV